MESVAEARKGKKKNAAAPVSAPPVPVIIAASIKDIDESPTNPRITFKGLPELAEDMKARGVLQPGLARPSPKQTGRYELVFAARRFRAAKLAGLPTFPLMVRDLTDEQVLEIQLAENGNRDDVHPLEEADGYRRGIDTHGWTVEELAAKVGKSVSTIHQRLKFCSLIPAAREAFLAGRLTAATALIVARVPQHNELQAKALEEILDYEGGAGLDDDVDRPPTSKNDASWIVRTKFMLRLVDAPFDRKDANLVAGAPACGDCPKRTGNQRDLFSDVSEKDDMCTDPVCFGSKRTASWEKKIDEAEAKGAVVLPEKESKKVFYGGVLRMDADYVDLGAKHYEGGAGKGQSFRSLLPKKADVPIIVARDDDGRVHELVAKKDFVKLAPKAAKQAGMTLSPRTSASSFASQKKRMEREQAKRKESAASQRATALVIGAAAEKRQPNDAFWRMLARAVARERAEIYTGEELAYLAGRLGVEWSDQERKPAFEKKLVPVFAKLKAERARGLIVEMLVGDEYALKETVAEFSALYGIKTKTKAKETVAEFSALYGIKTKTKAKARSGK